MPICDGYKATHLLRHHLPYKTFVRDVPIVAMTASAIQGDKEKCKRAGMDDYLAKPVQSKILEKMLVRWALNKRTLPTPLPSSAASDCSASSDNCTNSGIPCVGIEEQQEEAPQASQDSALPQAQLQKPGIEGGDDSRSSLLTPRPKVSPMPSQSFFDLPRSAEPSSPAVPHIRRVETDEMAQQSRDDKLIDAASGGAAGVSPLVHTPMIEKGEALTEANVEKFQREERLRRMSSD